MLTIKNLHVSVEGNQVLEGINLEIQAGEIHAIMGPNGSGKSTLGKVIAGHPDYEITDGSIQFAKDGETIDITELEPHERAAQGVFLGMQYPIEIPGVSNRDFLREAFNSICKAQGIKESSQDEFNTLLEKKINELNMNSQFLDRSLNEGFSGGEKKKNEILQLLVLNPRLAILDETDSGLDIDALKVVGDGVNSFSNRFNATILVTHYQRLLNFIKPMKVHVLAEGKIIKSAGPELALELEEKGYDWLL